LTIAAFRRAAALVSLQRFQSIAYHRVALVLGGVRGDLTSTAASNK
jgi:hypothetical protein